MENHPIPQDVTGFQFRLIGDMTVKQFAYLAVGCILAWLFFIAPLPLFAKIPLGILSGLFGAALAFVPIDGRPMDALAYYFLRALFAPNQYLYQKIGGTLMVDIRPPKQKTQKQKEETHSQIPKQKLEMLLSTLPKKPKNSLDEKETIFFESLSGAFNGAPLPTPPQTTPPTEQTVPLPPATEPPLPVTEPSLQPAATPLQDQARELALEKEAFLIQKELEQVRRVEAAPQANPEEITIAHKRAQDLEKELEETLKGKKELEKELLQLRQTLATQKVEAVKPVEMAAPAAPQPVRVRQIPKGGEKNAGLPFTSDYPNVIAGIVKDPRGNVLGNILVEVKDKDENPVRAFKTNPLGQFASATPLLNGIYTIWFEDPEGKHKFDVAEIEAKGEIIQPLEIISQDEREELRKALFN